jgi:hypothetical protein
VGDRRVAHRALPYAKTLARQEGGKLVVERYASHKASGLAVHADEEIVEAKLKKLAAQLSDEGFSVDLKIVSHVGPQPAHTIADIAQEAGGRADLGRLPRARGDPRTAARERDTASAARIAVPGLCRAFRRVAGE